jgi:hypothetical protein
MYLRRRTDMVTVMIVVTYVVACVCYCFITYGVAERTQAGGLFQSLCEPLPPSSHYYPNNNTCTNTDTDTLDSHHVELEVLDGSRTALGQEGDPGEYAQEEARPSRWRHRQGCLP